MRRTPSAQPLLLHNDQSISIPFARPPPIYVAPPLHDALSTINPIYAAPLFTQQPHLYSPPIYVAPTFTDALYTINLIYTAPHFAQDLNYIIPYLHKYLISIPPFFQ